jgi:choline dehydrogenase-like flavoprotein
MRAADLNIVEVQSDEDLDHYIRTTLHSGNALVGTCAMGLTPENGAVVDADLRVYGVRGLRVADSSVIPNIPGGLPGIWSFTGYSGGTTLFNSKLGVGITP